MAKEAGKSQISCQVFQCLFFLDFMMIFSVCLCFFFFAALDVLFFTLQICRQHKEQRSHRGRGRSRAGIGTETGRTTNVEQQDFYGFTAGNDFFIGASLGRSRETTMLLLFMALRTRFRFLSVYANMCVCVCVFVGQLNPFCM